MGSKAIEVLRLSKHFGSNRAVDSISFSVEEGEVFGFLGPNGAGKTTTIKMLTTLIQPTYGEAKVLGFDIRSEGRKIRSRIGVVQQQEAYDQSLSVEASLTLYGFLWGLPRVERVKRARYLMERFGLLEYRKTIAQDLSIGLRRRLQVAREFMHPMRLLFLDEPTLGLDPMARRSVLELLMETVKEGLTIFFTTHILSEAEYLCDRIAVINKGKIVAEGKPSELKRRFGRIKSLEFRLFEGSSRELEERLRLLEQVDSLEWDSSGFYRVSTSKPEEVIPALYSLAEELGLRVSSIYVSESSLEDAFISMVGGDEPSI